MVALVSIKSGRDAVFFTGSDLESLPLAYLWIAGASIPAAMLHLEAMAKLGTRATRILVLILAGSFFVALTPFVAVENYRAAMILFIGVPVAFAAVFASVWLLAADLLEGKKRALRGQTYTRMGFVSMLGGIMGGLLAMGLNLFLAPQFLILAGALLLFIVAFLVSRAHTSYPLKETEDPVTSRTDPESAVSIKLLTQGLSLVTNRYVIGLIGLSGVIGLCGLFIEFQFYTFAKITGRTQVDFFANFYTLLNLIGLALQILAGAWVQRRFGTGVALLILPVGLIAGTAVVAINSTLLTRAGLRIMESGLKASTHRFAWEQTFLPLKAEHRDMAKTLVDGLSARLAEGGAAIVLFFWLSNRSTALESSSLFWITGVLATFLILWILLILYLLSRGCGRERRIDEMFRLPEG